MRGTGTLRAALAAALLAVAGAACAQRGEVETVPPGDIEALAAGTQGVLFVSLSSADARCGYCVRQNAKFRAMAHDRPDVGRSVQMLWSPWTGIPPPVEAFLKAHGKQPAVPALAVFVEASRNPTCWPPGCSRRSDRAGSAGSATGDPVVRVGRGRHAPCSA